MGLKDAGGGAGTWSVGRIVFNAPGGRAVRLTLPPTVTVPGELNVSASVGRGSAPGDLDAYVELRRGADVRRVPVWARVTTGALARHKTLALTKPGLYRSSTLGQGSFVTRYRYPENPSGVDVTMTLRGPERVFRLRLTKPAANFGVVIIRRGHGSRVEPRVVAELDENRLTGYAGLPINHNPYMEEFREPTLAAGALSPIPGEYGVVFDSAARSGAGSFRFRYWVNDVTPPGLGLRTRRRASRSGRQDRSRRQRIRRLCELDPRVDRRRPRPCHIPQRRRVDLQPRGGAGEAPPPATCFRLPGDEEHGERRADPSQHAHAHDHLSGPLTDGALGSSGRPGRAAAGFRDRRDRESAQADSRSADN